MLGKKFSRRIRQDAVGTCRRTIGCRLALKLDFLAQQSDPELLQKISIAIAQIGGRSLQTMRTILLIIPDSALIGALPAWPYSAGWGYYPGGGLLLLIILILVLWRA